jgi:hypothetical protein
MGCWCAREAGNARRPGSGLREHTGAVRQYDPCSDELCGGLLPEVLAM